MAVQRTLSTASCDFDRRRTQVCFYTAAVALLVVATVTITLIVVKLQREMREEPGFVEQFNGSDTNGFDRQTGPFSRPGAERNVSFTQAFSKMGDFFDADDTADDTRQNSNVRNVFRVLGCYL